MALLYTEGDQPGPEEAQPQEAQSQFEPSLTRDQVKDYIKAYGIRPELFNNDFIKMMEDHASFYRVPFAKTSDDNRSAIGGILSSLGTGFFEGFTTLKLGDEAPPRNSWEAIAKNVGHLAGFVGWVPAKPFQLMRMQRLAKAAHAVKGRSIPMLAAKAVTDPVMKSMDKVLVSAVGARAAASKDAIGFLSGRLARDIIEGSFHLGVASAVGSWQGGVDEMMRSFIGGAKTGALFRGIGNVVQTGQPGADKILRGLSASLFMGIPSTLRGDTTPEQVYEYLLGAYFGVKEMPHQRRSANKFLNKMMKQEGGIPEPEEVPGWEALDPKTQGIVKEEAKPFLDKRQDVTHAVLMELRARGFDVNIEEAEQMSRDYLRSRIIEYDEFGEPRIPITEQADKDLVYRIFLEKQDTSSIAEGNINKMFDDNDLTSISRPTLSLKAQSYVDRRLNTVWEDLNIDKQREKQIRAYIDVDDKWTEVVKKHRAAGTRNPEEDMKKWVAKNYKVQWEPEDTQFFRGWGKQRLQGKTVPIWTTTVNSPPGVKEREVYSRPLTVFDESGSGVNDAGTRKRLVEEPKAIDVVYEMALARKGLTVETPAYVIVDHIVSNEFQGYYQEFAIEQYRDSLQRYMSNVFRKNASDPTWYQESQALAEKRWAEMNAHNFSELDKRGYYYYGGKGDAERQYFTQYHPDIDQVATFPSPSTFNLIRSAMPKGAKDYRWADIEADRKDFVQFLKAGGVPEDQAKTMYDKAYISNLMYTLELNGFSPEITKENMQKILGKGFVTSAKAFNKRAQIWFTTGLSADPDYVQERVPGAKNGELNFLLLKDAETFFDQGVDSKGRNKLGLNAKSTSMLAHEDGGILVTEEVVDAINSEAGLPGEGKFNKSFIVSKNADYGALLGKYGMHLASDPVQKWMKAHNVHMLINQSSAKQAGARNWNKVEWKDGQPRLYNMAGNKLGRIIGEDKVGNYIFKLPISDIKTVMTEKTDRHMLDPVNVPKQMQSNLTPYAYSPVDKAVIDDVFDTLSRRRFEGDEDMNAVAEKFIINPTQVELIDNLVNNLEDIGIDPMLRAIKSSPVFANRAYSKIMGVNDTIMNELFAEGEVTEKESSENRFESAEYKAIHDRLIRFMDKSLAGHLHKFTNDYRMAALRNYIVHTVTRPKVNNSFTGRMRPYEIGLQKLFPQFNRQDKWMKANKVKPDEIFMLDEGYRELTIRTDLFGKKGQRTTLGELWDLYSTGNVEKANIPQIEEIFRGVLARVPMDSMSGAHVLHFRGFTGVKGLGILLHSRTMEALGGADLDGDKSFGFFGDDANGFKASWKDMYHGQREEFHDTKAKKVYHNKLAIDEVTGKSYSELLSETDKDVLRKINNPALTFSPWRRKVASDAASSGRGLLGSAVVNRAVMSGSHAALRSLPERQLKWTNDEGKLKRITVPAETYAYEANFKDGSWIVFMKAKSSDKDMDRFRKMARASVALASDPMDEAGLKGREVIFDRLSENLFEWEVMRYKAGKWVADEFHTRQINGDRTRVIGTNAARWLRRQGLTSVFSGVNTALYGRNIGEGRRWTMGEIMDKIERTTNEQYLDPDGLWKPGISPDSRNTLLPKVADVLAGVDWSDGIFQRVNYPELTRMYDSHNAKVSKLDWLKNILGRSSFKVMRGSPEGRGDYINTVWKYKLFTRPGMEAQTTPGHSEYKEDLFEHFPAYSKRKGFDPSDRLKRKRYLLDMVRKAEDYIVNDMSDVASIKIISELSKQVMEEAPTPDIGGSRVRSMHEVANNIKLSSYLAMKQKIDPREIYDNLTEEQYKWMEALLKDIFPENKSAALDQARIDIRIASYKDGLVSDAERELFDQFMLGSVNRGFVDKIDGWLKKKKYVTKEMADIAHRMKIASSGTSLSRIGFKSKAVSDKSISRYTKEYSALFDRNIKAVPEKDQARVLKELEDAPNQPVRFVDDMGNIVKGTPLEQSDYDLETQKYMDRAAPFEGLHEGKLDHKAAEVVTSLTNHIMHYFPAKTGRELNGLVRGILGKELNNMTLEDFKMLDRWFTQVRGGTWYQKMFAEISDDQFVKLGKRHYYMFPRAVNRDLMRAEIQLVKDRGVYKDQHGNVVSGVIYRPTNVGEELQQIFHGAQQYSVGKHEEFKGKLFNDLRPYVYALEEGVGLHELAVTEMDKAYATKELLPKHGTGAIYGHYAQGYIANERKANFEYGKLRDQKFIVRIGDTSEQLSGRQIIERIKETYKTWNVQSSEWLRGGAKFDEFKALWETTEAVRGTDAALRAVRDKFIKEAYQQQQKGLPYDMSLGIDGTKWVASRIMVLEVPGTQETRAKALKSLQWREHKTGQIDFDKYWPHMLFDKKKAAENLKVALKNVLNDTSYGTDEAGLEARDKQLKKLTMMYHQVTGDWVTRNDIGEQWDKVHNILNDISVNKKAAQERINDLQKPRIVGNMLSREVHVPGWNTQPEVYDLYMKNIIDSFHMNVAQIMARHNIDLARRRWTKDRRMPPELVNAWSNYWSLYANEAMGAPVKIPEYMLNDPNMQLDATAYKWWADDRMAKRMDGIRKWLGLKKTDPDLPDPLDSVSFETLRSLGQLEAKYELATLLAHPKSSIANLYGGTVHTLISTGWRNFKRSRDMNFLKTHINPKWESKDDVEAWVRSHGVVEEFLLYEANINPALRTKQWQGFMKDAVGKIRSDPEFSDVKLRGLAKTHGISDIIFNKAAWFMRRPERTLRRDAFLAHYLMARERFGPMIKDLDHPYLIEIAKRGVKGTQFLYSAPFRPAFSRSQLGKVMTRFHTWAWNSVRFRKDIINEADLHGWKEGTPAFKRFQRMATADLMMFGLGNVFMYSIFENALPAPWNWIQDFSELMFSADDKERERAFFGAWPRPFQPLQIVTPPIARLLPPMFKAMVQDDYSRLSEYYVYTMFPFGRFIRDIAGPGGMMENPSRAVEKMTGLPYMQLSRQATKYKEDETIRVG